jgi:DNA-binding NtrC family response regulator
MNSSVKILLVEDEPQFQEVLKKFLGVFYDIHTCSTLNEARRILYGEESANFNVVLLDKGLPDGSGIELLEQIRNQFIDTAIIMLTGDSDFNAANKCISLGANDYVIKSEDIVQELLIRIPIVLKVMALQREMRNFQSSPALQLPLTYSDLKPDHYKNYMANAEREYFRAALPFCRGEVSTLAKVIGLSRSTIFKKMTVFGIEKRSWIHRSIIRDEDKIDDPQIDKETFSNITIPGKIT